MSSLTTPRPNLTGAPLYLTTGNPINYLNAAAFSVPSYTQPWGNARAQHRAHSGVLRTWISGCTRTSRILSEARFLQFRAEAFNLLNKTNFAPPGTLSANSSGFGVFSSSFPARQIQLALKFVF